MNKFKFVKVDNGKFHSVRLFHTWLLNGVAHCGLGLTDDEVTNWVYPQGAPIKQRCLNCRRAVDKINSEAEK